MLEPGRNCWRVERAQRATLIVDAAHYFRMARQAMLRADRQILLIGWDFDTRIYLDDSPDGSAPGELGPLLTWLAKHRPDVQVYILRWRWGTVKLLARGTTIFRLARWAFTKQISFKLDGAHPWGASHHQKITVVDDKLAFCGGIDMTATRWDTREHLDDDPRRKRPTTGRSYGPWHDATMAVDGAAARALGELARERWLVAGGGTIAPPDAQGDPWPPELKPAFRNVDLAIARTRGPYKEVEPLREVEALYVDMIKRARRFLYAENQFFASRVVGEAIAERLMEPDGPEFVIVNPKIVDGCMEDEVMRPARSELVSMLARADRHGRFRVYTPVTEGGEDIYVHSKITIVDGVILRVGSANLNNRSMGLDSECDLLLDSRLEANDGSDEQIASTLADLLAEHLDVSQERVAETLRDSGSIIETVESLRGSGRTLVPLEVEKPNAVEAMIAENEILDPEISGGASDRPERPGLIDSIAGLLRHRRQSPAKREDEEA